VTTPLPFKLDVDPEILGDLNRRLAAARLPDEPPLPAWSTGTSVDYMRDLLAYWRSGFDWRAHERKLNAFRQFKVPLGDIDVHFIHEPGVGPRPFPLLLSHGWPGSVWEFHRLIPMLTDPGRHGGDPADAFTVVAPSLPGYTLSFKPGQKRFSVEDIADTFATLMTDVLGYTRFAAQGGDWGSFVTARLGYRYAARTVGIHLNLMPVRRDPKAVETANAAERRYLDELNAFLKEETGYQWIQGTRPTTLAYGLTDSPAGLAAWIVEKFRAWTDNDGTPDSAVSRDDMLANIMLYWVTGAIGSSFWPYYARMHGPWPIPEGSTVDVPMGYTQFPREILRPPRSLCERTFTNIVRWSEMPRGGHFAALEQPEALAREIREFFRPLRG
jgi:pimeloyl-ACP methyl ester carboxylesterase